MSTTRPTTRRSTYRWAVALALFLVTSTLTGVAVDWILAREGTYSYLKLFNEVLLLVQHSYVEEIETPGLMRGAYDGLLAALDPASEYLTRDQYVRLTRAPSPSEGDVGMNLSRRGGYLYVISAVPGSPADLAGLGTGTRLRRINGRSTREMTLTEGLLILRGEVGTEVVVQPISRRGAADDGVTLLRARVESPEPEVHRQDDAVVLRIPTLRPGTAAAARRALGEAKVSRDEPILLDLRGNSIGEYDEAARLVSLFLEGGEVGRLRERVREGRVLLAEGGEPILEGPAAILVDVGTAGPAELVAQAMRSRAAVPLMGRATFGWSRVQTYISLNDGALLRLSVARAEGPDGETWDDNGLEPDHVLEEKQAADDAGPEGEDSTLQRALELLRTQAEVASEAA